MCLSSDSNEIADVGATVATLGRRISDDPRDAVAYLLRAESLWLLRDHAAAIADLDTAIIGHDGLSQEQLGYAYYRRSICRHQTGAHRGAAEDATAALALRPTAHTWAVRAIARFFEGDLVGTVADANAALVVDPGEWEARAYRGRALLRLGDVDGAIDDLTWVIDSGACHKYSSHLRRLRAEALLERNNPGDVHAALHDVDAAIDGDHHEQIHYPYLIPGRAARAYATYLLRSRVQLAAGNAGAALADAFWAVSLAPGEPATYRQRAAAAAALGDHRSAVADYARAALLEPGPPALAQDSCGGATGSEHEVAIGALA